MIEANEIEAAIKAATAAAAATATTAAATATAIEALAGLIKGAATEEQKWAIEEMVDTANAVAQDAELSGNQMIMVLEEIK